MRIDDAKGRIKLLVKVQTDSRSMKVSERYVEDTLEGWTGLTCSYKYELTNFWLS